MHETAVRATADERRRAERKQRHLQDDLRYALKKMQEPLDLNITFEDVSRLPSLAPVTQRTDIRAYRLYL